MSLLEFLRKSNAEGNIIRWLKEKYNREPKEERPSLEEFAQQYVCQGEKAIAPAMGSRLRDRYYGQWQALHVPFEELDDLLVPEISEKVPERYQQFAGALHHRPDYWNDLDRIRKDMELEANGNDHIETVLRLVKAQAHLVQQYLRGEARGSGWSGYYHHTVTRLPWCLSFVLFATGSVSVVTMYILKPAGAPRRRC